VRKAGGEDSLNSQAWIHEKKRTLQHLREEKEEHKLKGSNKRKRERQED